jgi:hypothetical protein
MFDWKSIKEKAHSISDNLSAIADEISTSTKEIVADVKSKADDTLEDVMNIAKDASDKAVEIWESEEIVQVRNKAMDIAAETGNKASEVWNSEGVTKFRGSSRKAMRVVTGMQAVEDRRKSIQTREEADHLKAEIEETNEALRDDMNEMLESFGKFRLEALSATVGKFLHCLEIMNQKAKGKEYEFLSEIDIQAEEIKEMEAVDMKASDALRTLAVGGGFAAIGVIGTPAIVTGAVTAMCAAGTGTAISTLSGAAASNAVLAWLGGGTIAAGGGGVAAGTVVLGAITATATIGLAVVAVGTLASKFYAKKNSEAEAYLAEVKVWAEQMQASWTILGGIKRRIEELHDLTAQLEERASAVLGKLETLAPVFDTNNNNHVTLFQQSAILAKSMSELAQTSILDNDGNISDESGIIAAKTQKILNSEL